MPLTEKATAQAGSTEKVRLALHLLKLSSEAVKTASAALLLVFAAWAMAHAGKAGEIIQQLGVTEVEAGEVKVRFAHETADAQSAAWKTDDVLSKAMESLAKNDPASARAYVEAARRVGAQQSGVLKQMAGGLVAATSAAGAASAPLRVPDAGWLYLGLYHADGRGAQAGDVAVASFAAATYAQGVFTVPAVRLDKPALLDGEDDQCGAVDGDTSSAEQLAALPPPLGELRPGAAPLQVVDSQKCAVAGDLVRVYVKVKVPADRLARFRYIKA